MESGVSLREITDQNREAVIALRIAASQEGYVSSVADSLEEARDAPEANPWYRAIYADGQPVGFVMLSWNVTPDPRESSDRGSSGSC
jgi:diamine N-acetyltransferase